MSSSSSNKIAKFIEKLNSDQAFLNSFMANPAQVFTDSTGITLTKDQAAEFNEYVKKYLKNKVPGKASLLFGGDDGQVKVIVSLDCG